MKINSEEEFNEFIKKDLVLIDFYAEWCGPCKMMGPVLENVEKNNNIKIGKINVDELSLLAQKYGVMSIPTLILFKDNKLIDKKIGYVPEPVLNEWIKK